ncbi:beta and beta-prime subunits of DNA dependent RNA-polymerase [Lepidopterella palustris CBS 459.81]|uniref:DNA-directed RNA polymerase subunit n=1 Tax=Lepidopterella palustris CBS 459.81 TaxID=1314670 RepID=A0A8E2J9Q9_9PEZI|nr:beta and beta-prime subunits of DNA dependent RNA-polymerase [Lepidopterella palustris CBS 459.81]
MNTFQPVSSAISGVEFGFLSADEIRALSVKRITNPTTFDSLLHPVPGGLHDSALGAFLDNPCSTCNQGFGCPGHCGHIELPMPVYHLTFMDQCLRLLRAKCVYCHRLKMAAVQVNRYTCKLRLIRYGLLKEAEDIENLNLWSSKRKSASGAGDDLGSSEEVDEDHIISQQNSYVKKMIKQAGGSKGRGERTTEKTEAISEARKIVIKDFLLEIGKGKKCRNCQGINPTYRKDRYIKIFRRPLNSKDRATMAADGKKMINPVMVLENRRNAHGKQGPSRVHSDEGVADLDAESLNEEEDEEMSDVEHEADGNLIATETATTPARKDGRTAIEYGPQEYMNPAEVLACLTLLFEHEQEILRMVYSPQLQTKSHAAVSADMFFIQCVIIPPNKYRMEDKTGDSISESPKNTLYKGILLASELMRQIKMEIDGHKSEKGYRQRDFHDLEGAWVNLQGCVNSLIDKESNPIQGNAGKSNAEGIKQQLEKKEGLFRKNMMGKRVNFAARSVISPDPNIETNEIGVPPVFAKRLTYPEPVTNHNFYDLKEAVLNGPNKWPGAVAIENEHGQVINLKKKNFEERQALANQLLAPTSTDVNGARNKKVHRHLNNGDVVIMNRQPTLHKPSMMAHRARVLPGEKTIRMHYANCNTYNADFDGDEMNMHFPQNEIARAEAATIADTDHQYLSATAGKPLRGLIQDHISMGVWLTNRDTFFNREDYQQLLYAALRPEDSHTTSGTLITIQPAILRPRPLWTGKQVITTVLRNIKPETHPGLTLSSKSSTSATLWGDKSEEQTVVFKDGDLLCGILDKSQIGPTGGGFVNAIYETYGHTVAGRLLSVLGRLLTKLLHMRAFSCGVEDLILTSEGERTRRDNMKDVNTVGLKVAAKYVSLSDENVDSNNSELRKRLEQVLRSDSKQAGLDVLTNGQTKDISSKITSACLPNRLIKPFPKNQMQAMTGSGAKGTLVNANQISCNLGQQVLEGRRVPVMVSGKTLPCFKPFETNIRAGGYITNRFLTGVRPQEYYFHAMAGREGLIDTAVKTSRSGYLQRCIIKGMEGLKVEYDTSVRDSDGSMIQFLYGEDGLDTTKAKALNDFKFLADNFVSLFQSLNMGDDYAKIQSPEAMEWTKAAYKKARKTGDLAAMDPATAVYAPSRFAGSTSEKFYAARKEYCDENPDKLLKKKKKDPEGVVVRKNFEAALDVKYLKSIIEPGEAVGVVAGQSIGEPSTQMTLNTFHLAGHAAKNVTLGIPRLREIIMTASASISTPSMTLHLHPEIPKADGETFAKSISRLPLSAVVDKVTVTETLGKGIAYDQAKSYRIRLDFYPSEEYCKEYAIKVEDVVFSIENKFIPRLQKMIRAELKKKGQERSLKLASHAKSDAVMDIGVSAGVVEQERTRPQADREVGDDDEESDGGDDEGDATNEKRRGKREDSVEFEAPDEEEEAIAAQARREASPDPEREDETYGGSPREGNTPALSNTDADSDNEAPSEIDPRRSVEDSVAARVDRGDRIMNACSDVSQFKFDYRNGQWCQITFEYSATTAKLLMLHLVEDACNFATIQVIPGIANCLVSTEKGPRDPFTGKETELPVVVTEGANLVAMRDYQHIIDPNRIFTNDIAAMLRLYGVEACRACIIREMHAVFSGHGISVDHRHLNLIADTMTRGGGYTPFNRNGLKSSVSPFMKMSFETTVGFLRDAVLERDWDDLRNPSARIVMGKLSKVGTGAFDVLMPVG